MAVFVSILTHTRDEIGEFEKRTGIRFKQIRQQKNRMWMATRGEFVAAPMTDPLPVSPSKAGWTCEALHAVPTVP